MFYSFCLLLSCWYRSPREDARELGVRTSDNSNDSKRQERWLLVHACLAVGSAIVLEHVPKPDACAHALVEVGIYIYLLCCIYAYLLPRRLYTIVGVRYMSLGKTLNGNCSNPVLHCSSSKVSSIHYKIPLTNSLSDFPTTLCFTNTCIFSSRFSFPMHWSLCEVSMRHTSMPALLTTLHEEGYGL